MQSYLKYKAYYDRKAKAPPLETTDYCYILNPKADTQASKIPFRKFRWQGPYKVEEVLPNNTYIDRRLGTNKTQLLHRIRMRKFTPQAPLADIFVRESDWQKDDQMSVAHDDFYAQSWKTNIGPNPFEEKPPDVTLNDDDVEYVPCHVPEINQSPSRKISKTSDPQEEINNEISQETHSDETNSPQNTQNDKNITPEEKTPKNPRKLTKYSIARKTH